MVILLLVVVAGCEPPVLVDHPLSDEKTARIDDELIGYWKQVDLDDEADTHPVPMAIGRSKTHPRLHEGVHTELADDGQVTVHRLRIPTTTQEVDVSRTPLRLITVAARDLNPDEREAKGYLVVRYEIQAGQRLKIFMMNSLAIAQAIESNKLAGVAKRTKPPADGSKPKTKYEEIRITANPAELRAFLKKTGTSCFEKKQTLEFQKIVTD